MINQKLTETYSAQSEDHATPTTWYVELLLVFAIGQLLDGQTRSIHDQPPGYTYFQQAMDILPNACTLQNEGTLGVEIMALATFYLQCSDRKDDAYVNVRIPECRNEGICNSADVLIGRDSVEACYGQSFV